MGEIHDVLEDLSSIIGQDFLEQADVKQALREYFENHKQAIDFWIKNFLVEKSELKKSQTQLCSV